MNTSAISLDELRRYQTFDFFLDFDRIFTFDNADARVARTIREELFTGEFADCIEPVQIALPVISTAQWPQVVAALGEISSRVGFAIECNDSNDENLLVQILGAIQPTKYLSIELGNMRTRNVFQAILKLEVEDLVMYGKDWDLLSVDKALVSNALPNLKQLSASIKYPYHLWRCLSLHNIHVSDSIRAANEREAVALLHSQIFDSVKITWKDTWLPKTAKNLSAALKNSRSSLHIELHDAELIAQAMPNLSSIVPQSKLIIEIRGVHQNNIALLSPLHGTWPHVILKMSPQVPHSVIIDEVHKYHSVKVRITCSQEDLDYTCIVWGMPLAHALVESFNGPRHQQNSCRLRCLTLDCRCVGSSEIDISVLELLRQAVGQTGLHKFQLLMSWPNVPLQEVINQVVNSPDNLLVNKAMKAWFNGNKVPTALEIKTLGKVAEPNALFKKLKSLGEPTDFYKFLGKAPC